MNQLHKCNNCDGNCWECATKQKVVPILIRYVQTKKACRRLPNSIRSFHPENPEYDRICEEYRQATRDLWEVTDREYSEDGLSDKMWNWRFAKVMARKCTHYMRLDGNGVNASNTMKKLDDAERELFKAFGLENFYVSPETYIKEHFPNLCSKAPENIIITDAT